MIYVKNKKQLPTRTLTSLLVLFAISQANASGLASDLNQSSQTNEPQLEHIEQSELNILVNNDPAAAFITAFEVGDELFEAPANELDGAGANVGEGQRFAKFPRMDLNGYGEWATHTPARVTGPNSQACIECHFQAVSDGSGPISGNNVRDPMRSGQIGDFITRQPPHIFGIGAKQKLAEEMTAELLAIKAAAIAQATSYNTMVTKDLIAKNISFGKIKANPDGSVNTSMVEGVDEDLIVKPLQWKGVELSIRSFVRGAENNEIGLQATELVGNYDGDYDGIINEISVGDITALAIYQAGQPRPVTKTELADLGLMELSYQERADILKGKDLFNQVQCASCHVPTLYLDDSIFSEPSQSATHRDTLFPNGDSPASHGLTPANAITFDLAADMPDNIITLPNGNVVHLGNFKKDSYGRTSVDIYSDLKRHDLGYEIAESVDEEGTGASVFITQPLWGAGSTAPYMHDGRSPTITDAVMNHGGDAATSRSLFKQLSPTYKQALVAYVENHILLLAEEDEEEAAAEAPIYSEPVAPTEPEAPTYSEPVAPTAPEEPVYFQRTRR